MKEENSQEQNGSGPFYMRSVLPNDARANQHDGEHRHHRRRRDDLPHQPGKPVVDHQSKQDGQQHDLEGAFEQSQSIDRNIGACEPFGEQRCHDNCSKGCAHRHENGKGDVRLGNVSHHIRSRAARTASYQDKTDRQGCLEPEQMRHRPAHQRHN